MVLRRIQKTMKKAMKPQGARNQGDKYCQLVRVVNAGLSLAGTTASLVYTRDNARLAPTGDIFTLLAKLDGPPIPAEYILEAMNSFLNIGGSWLRIQNTGQAVIVAGCSTKTANCKDQIWPASSPTISLAAAKSLWVSSSSVKEMKRLQKLKNAPLATMMYISFYRGSRTDITIRFAFYRSDSEPNLIKITRRVQEAIDSAEQEDSYKTAALLKKTLMETTSEMPTSHSVAESKPSRSIFERVTTYFRIHLKCLNPRSFSLQPLMWVLMGVAWPAFLTLLIFYLIRVQATS
ncbi:nuclear egress membrane protein [Gallid alphaherpesvirus 1]|uniref:Nuclear egress membrane protein n=1 Tax=Infectious laryngotracheitis virus TaxID=10386 RepID=A0A0K0K607_ILTV|nr:nuclear egress membrane protein [Gallid alphaherpesvirus 1]